MAVRTAACWVAQTAQNLAAMKAASRVDWSDLQTVEQWAVPMAGLMVELWALY